MATRVQQGNMRRCSCRAADIRYLPGSKYRGATALRCRTNVGSESCLAFLRELEGGRRTSVVFSSLLPFVISLGKGSWTMRSTVRSEITWICVAQLSIKMGSNQHAKSKLEGNDRDQGMGGDPGTTVFCRMIGRRTPAFRPATYPNG